MKLSFILVLLATLHLSAATYGQRVKLNYDGADMVTVLRDIQRATGFNLGGKFDLVKRARPVTVRRDSIDLAAALRLLEDGQDIRFSVQGRNILINEAHLVVPTTPMKNMEDTAKEDGFVLRGQIIGENELPLAEVTIQNTRTGKGTYSRNDGTFTLYGVNPGDKIVMSYIGYSAYQISPTGPTFLDVKLNTTINELDVVQKEGYRLTSRRLSTSNVVTIKSDVIERQPVANPLQALQGRVSGLIVTQTAGYASGPIEVYIRGLSSINGFNSPLYVVDGIPLNSLTLITENNVVNDKTGFNQSGITGPPGGQSPLYSINPHDIESISVLKDADATAVYGSRGGKGVILITTKKGQPGKAKFDLTFSKGINYVPRSYDMLNSTEYIQMRKEAFANSAITPSRQNAYDILAWDTTRNTNWQKYFWNGTGDMIEGNVSLSGGDKLTTFRIGGGLTKITPLYGLSGSDDRYTSQISISHKSLNRKLNVSFANYFSYTKSDMISLNGPVLLPPTAPPVFADNGKLNYSGWEPASNRFVFASVLQPYTAKTTFINSDLNLSYQIFKSVRISTDFGYSQNFQNQTVLFPIASLNPRNNPTGRSISGSSNTGRIIIEPQIEYRNFIGSGEFIAMLGAAYQTVNQEGQNTQGVGFTNDYLLRSIDNAPIQTGTNIGGQYRYAAGFGRITYNWRSKLLTNFTARRDGSSRFAEGNNFGNFWSVGLGYIFSEESFIKNKLSFLSYGKIRGSYGLTGSDLIADYKYISRWQSIPQSATYLNSSVYHSLQHSNPNIEWQTDKQLDVGLQLGFLQDKIGMELSWYQRRSGNQLLDFRLPAATGFDIVTANFPATVQNRGIEANITWTVTKKKDVTVRIFANAGYNRNILLRYPGLDKSPYASLYSIGEPLRILKLLHYLHVDPSTGEYVYEDRNKDGKIDIIPGSATNDLSVQDLSIKCDGGFGADVSYKGFEINLFCQVRIGNGRNAYYTGGAPGAIINIPRVVYDGRWKGPGDTNAQFARLTVLPKISDENFRNSDGIISNASFLRLNNLSLAYNLSERFRKAIGIRESKVFIKGQNLFVLTKYKGADPEQQSFGSFPLLTVLTGGIRVAL